MIFSSNFPYRLNVRFFYAFRATVTPEVMMVKASQKMAG
jgi:hypothetical protein